jgi:hypothetical protein
LLVYHHPFSSTQLHSSLCRKQGVTTSYDSITLTDNINILFRQQTQLFGKTLFLTVYALIIAFLFLPASLLTKQQGILASLRATYVISEQEHRILVKTRYVTVC